MLSTDVETHCGDSIARPIITPLAITCLWGEQAPSVLVLPLSMAPPRGTWPGCLHSPSIVLSAFVARRRVDSPGWAPPWGENRSLPHCPSSIQGAPSAPTAPGMHCLSLSSPPQALPREAGHSPYVINICGRGLWEKWQLTGQWEITGRVFCWWNILSCCNIAVIILYLHFEWNNNVKTKCW